jgi:hypothetical protein
MAEAGTVVAQADGQQDFAIHLRLREIAKFVALGAWGGA